MDIIWLFFMLSALQPMSVTLPLVLPESDFIAAICRAAKAPTSLTPAPTT